MPYNLESTATICAASVDHDPHGTHREFYEPASRVLNNLYYTLEVNFTTRTHPDTIQAARDCGWCVNIVNLSVGRNRFFALQSALKKGCDFINLWDGDRLLYAAMRSPGDLLDLVTATPLYDHLIVGATPDAIASHPKSLTVWEGVKSGILGFALGIDGDIGNRGCLGFSKEFAEFAVQYPPAPEDDADGTFPLLAIAYKKHLGGGKIENGRPTIGYREYDKAFRYENPLFVKGVTAEGLAQLNNTYPDFMHRAESALRVFANVHFIDKKFGLDLFKGESFWEMNNRLVNELRRPSSV